MNHELILRQKGQLSLEILAVEGNGIDMGSM